MKKAENKLGIIGSKDMRAVIITENQYPCEDAGAIRQHATAKILEELGYSVIVLGYGKPTSNKVLTYEGIEYISFRPNSKNKYIRAAYRATACSRMMSYLKRNCKNADLILVADVFANTIKSLNRYAKGKDLILIHDSVEWFSAEEFRKKEKEFAYKTRDEINRKLVGDGWRVMAISRYLEDHFSKKCDKTVRIPVIMDTTSIEHNDNPTPDGKKIKFAYVGGPGKKDYLKNMVEGFERITKDLREKTEFHIVGVTKQQLASVCGVSQNTLDNLGEFLVVHGRLPHAEAIRFVREADFTLLFRDAELRYAKAGFPTKIVESLSSATPPVCNLSSDLELYLKDGENAFVTKGHSPEEIKAVLERAIATSEEQRKQMRLNARKTAEEAFDYRKYITLFAELVK